MSSDPDPTKPPSVPITSKKRGPYKPRMKSGEPTTKLSLRSKKHDLIGKLKEVAQKAGIKHVPDSYFMQNLPDKKRPRVPLEDKTPKERLYWFNRLKADELRKEKANEDAKYESLKNHPIVKMLMKNPKNNQYDFQTVSNLLNEMCRDVIKTECPDKVEYRWGFKIQQPHSSTVLCPPEVVSSINELNAKSKWNRAEKESIKNFLYAIYAQMLMSSSTALHYTMSMLCPPLNNRKSAIETPKIPTLQDWVNCYMDKFLGNIKALKELPSLSCSEKLLVNDDKLELSDPGNNDVSITKIMQPKGNESTSKNETPLALLNETVKKLKIRNTAEKWGVVGGIKLTVQDVLEMLTSDYSDTVIDAEGARIFDDAQTDSTTTSVIYFPTYLSQLFAERNFSSDIFLGIVNQITKCKQDSTILFPFHNADAADHWQIVIVTLSAHATHPSQINLFDPLKPDSTLGNRLDNNEPGIQKTVDFLLDIKRFMNFIFPLQEQWTEGFHFPWPLNLINIDIPEIPSQGKTRECGPVLVLLMNYYANSKTFDWVQLHKDITAKDWKEVRYAHYAEFENVMK